MSEPGPDLLVVDGLSLTIQGRGGPRQVLSGVDLRIRRGDIVGLVGESGSGKSLTALSIMGLLPPATRPHLDGSIRLDGRELVGLRERDYAPLRGRCVAYVPQEPMNALNPTLRISRQLGDVLRQHGKDASGTVRERARALLADMAITDPDRVLDSYPFELSGGLRQRVLIAIAFAASPGLILADEPTTALDVTVQAQILLLLRERARARGTAVLLVSHDLGVIAQMCDRMYVMYAGTIVERGPTQAVLLAPAHPYTRALLASRPASHAPREPLFTLPAGGACAAGACAFRPRCPEAHARCDTAPPMLPVAGSAGVESRCWLHAAGREARE